MDSLIVISTVIACWLLGKAIAICLLSPLEARWPRVDWDRLGMVVTWLPLYILIVNIF